MILNSVVLWIHIFGAIGWLGSGMVFAIVIGPSLGKLSPQARTEFLVKVLPKYLRYVEVFSILAVLAGIAMVEVIADGDYSVMSLSTHFGLFINVGAAIALVTIGVAFSVIIPTARKIVRLSETMMKAPGPPPQELISASTRLRQASMLGMFLLIIVTMFMVAAATGV